MNALDIVLVVVVVLAAVSGYRRGALMQVLAYGGLVAGLVAGALLAPPIASLVRGDAAQAGVAVAVLLGAAGIGNATGWLAGSYVRAHARKTRFGAADAAGGSLVSMVAVAVAIWFLAFNLVKGPFSSLAGEIRGSTVVRTIDRAMPRPPSLLGQVGQFFDRWFPDVFTGVPPAPAGPVEWPTQAQAGRAFAAGHASMVRIVGRACGEIQSGSGFVVGRNDVVTNAHVVAGVAVPEVQRQNGGAQRGTVVLFDPETDLAVVRVEEAPGAPLRLLRGEVDRGTGGAVLGFPGGGDLNGERAAIRRNVFEAVGRDIYGRHTVVRKVYEIQADVEPGDSGAPFVLPDGRVAGIVFAASTTDPGIGYAISSTAAIDDVAMAIRRTTPVGTGACVR